MRGKNEATIKETIAIGKSLNASNTEAEVSDT